MDFPQRSGHHLDVGELGSDVSNHAEKGGRVKLALGGHFGARDAQAKLQVLLIANKDVHVVYDALDLGDGPFVPADDIPELGAVVQVKRSGGARCFRGFHPFHNHLGGGLRQRGENAAAMEPADAAAEDGSPVKIAGLQLLGGFVGAVIEHDGSANAQTAVAIDRGHVGAMHAIVYEVFVERLHAHRPYALGDQVADGIIHHRGGDACGKAETVREVGGYIELAPADVNLAFGGFTEGNDAGVQAVDKRTKGEEVECAVRPDVQAVFHEFS